MIFHKIFLILILSVVVANATSLKEIIQSTLENNDNIKASVSQTKAKQKSYESAKNIYNPTATIGANYSRLDLDKREVQVGSTASGFLNIGVNLYDGGKNKAIKNQKNYNYKASLLNTTTTKKETVLQVVTLFFEIKTLTENIKVFEEKGITLEAQYKRVKIKYNTKMVTEDEVLKLQSEHEANQHIVEELKYQKINLLENISLLSNSKVGSLDDSTLPQVQEIEFEESENFKALKMGVKAVNENVKIISAVNKPQLRLENNLNAYNYNDYNNGLLSDLPKYQNQLMLSLSYRLYDTQTSDNIEASKLELLASKQRLNFIKNQERVRFKLAKKKLATQQLKINSLKSAVEMGEAVFKMVNIKYENGIVDNITYLDALSKKTYNQALYQEALNNYEIAKANYYFSSGIDYKDIMNSW